MTTNETCPATWHDELNPADDHVYGCTLEYGHHGTHRNNRAGITWGGAAAWFDGDAA